ncbi:unnamed protein product [Cylicostephanus goldi]|uniref:Uncharacterized protein n=1 Tax=Cylicostephanus goldi TaxID=71465 RepID=A0A3P7M3E1_CYLGO|nr:unnamed protein product [Cylicostephanus goldi]
MGVHQFKPDENEAVLAELYPKFFTDFIRFGQPRQEVLSISSQLGFLHDKKNRQILCSLDYHLPERQRRAAIAQSVRAWV